MFLKCLVAQAVLSASASEVDDEQVLLSTKVLHNSVRKAEQPESISTLLDRARESLLELDQNHRDGLDKGDEDWSGTVDAIKALVDSLDAQSRETVCPSPPPCAGGGGGSEFMILAEPGRYAISKTGLKSGSCRPGERDKYACSDAKTCPNAVPEYYPFVQIMKKNIRQLVQKDEYEACERMCSSLSWCISFNFGMYNATWYRDEQTQITCSFQYLWTYGTGPSADKGRIPSIKDISGDMVKGGFWLQRFTCYGYKPRHFQECPLGDEFKDRDAWYDFNCPGCLKSYKWNKVLDPVFLTNEQHSGSTFPPAYISHMPTDKCGAKMFIAGQEDINVPNDYCQNFCMVRKEYEGTPFTAGVTTGGVTTSAHELTLYD